MHTILLIELINSSAAKQTGRQKVKFLIDTGQKFDQLKFLMGL